MAVLGAVQMESQSLHGRGLGLSSSSVTAQHEAAVLMNWT